MGTENWELTRQALGQAKFASQITVKSWHKSREEGALAVKGDFKTGYDVWLLEGKIFWQSSRRD